MAQLSKKLEPSSQNLHDAIVGELEAFVPDSPWLQCVVAVLHNIPNPGLGFFLG
ncbi:ATP-binding protein [Sesbania bispinosa]|nr:ATP-binding protein [Sesbania bispinosa]